jgi:hypothetical protein
MPDFAKILLILFVLNGLVFAQSLPELEKVKEIKLLESTRDDVRRILGGYKFNSNKASVYFDKFFTDNAIIEIVYSKRRCKVIEPNSWNAEDGVVTDVEIILKKPIHLKNLELKISNLKVENLFTDQDYPKVYHRKDLGIVMQGYNEKIETIRFIPPIKSYSKRCDSKLSKRLLSTTSIFDPKIKERERGELPLPRWAVVLDLLLDRTEVSTNCSSTDVNDEKTCIVAIAARYTFTLDDVLTFEYKVSGGKIIGKGERVLWDLSDVKPGTYTITATVDDGCGFCGKPLTKVVTVSECSDCKNPEHSTKSIKKPD